MALNVPLEEPGGQPRSLLGETIVAIVEKVMFQIESGGGYPGNPGSFYGRGNVYLSNQRIVFSTNPPQRYFTSFALPLANIRNEAYKQPIFSANNLCGTCIPVSDGNSGLTGVGEFRILFKNGGEGEFVGIGLRFIRLAQENDIPSGNIPIPQQTRQQMTAGMHPNENPYETILEQDNVAGYAQTSVSVAPMSPSAAFVDPADPLTIYLPSQQQRGSIQEATPHSTTDKVATVSGNFPSAPPLDKR